MEAELRPLVTAFQEHAHENARKMRELLDRDRAAFPLAATRIFRDSAIQKGHSYLVTILWTKDLLTPLFLDDGIPLPLCIAMAQAAAKIDSHFHVQLSNFLQEGVLNSDDVPVSMVTRILEILSATMEPSAMSPLLRRILLHPNAQIRSKAMLLIGRSPAGVGAIERLIPDEDPRVRANALESLWSSSDPRVTPIFKKSLNDPNNRVAGNAILGLYLAGAVESIAAVFDLAASESALARGTAAWIMGKTGDPRFQPILGRMVGESSGQLRKIVFHALQSIKKKAAARAARTIKLKVMSSHVDGERLRFRLCVAETPGSPRTTLPATAFIIGTESESAIDYACQGNRGKRLAIDFVVPSDREAYALHRAAETAIDNFRTKRPDQEHWKVLEYSSGPAVRQAFIPFKFMGVEALPLANATALHSASSLFAIIQSAIQNAPLSAASRHLVALVAGPSGLDEESERILITSGRSRAISLHVLSTTPDVQMQRISQSLLGSFQVLSSLTTVQDELERLYDCLASSYLIDVPASILERSSSGPITVQVNSASGWGKCEIESPL